MIKPNLSTSSSMHNEGEAVSKEAAGPHGTSPARAHPVLMCPLLCDNLAPPSSPMHATTHRVTPGQGMQLVPTFGETLTQQQESEAKGISTVTSFFNFSIRWWVPYFPENVPGPFILMVTRAYLPQDKHLRTRTFKGYMARMLLKAKVVLCETAA